MNSFQFTPFSILLLILAVSLTGGRLAASRSQQPPTLPLSVNANAMDLGDVSAEQPLRYAFVVDNHSSQRVVLNRKECACRSDSTQPQHITILPGQSIQILVDLPTDLGPGTFTNTETFFTGLPQQPKLEFKLTGTVLPATPSNSLPNSILEPIPQAH